MQINELSGKVIKLIYISGSNNFEDDSKTKCKMLLLILCLLCQIRS